ncbi:MAG TPA: serine hydrolase domain-containing protein [Acidimicrobiia bacterium]|nr:serine hydrolase domain-containing protein [Acidimicrobiia bacterium]
MGQAEGFVADGFERVRDVFEENFAKGLEVGASFAVYHRGELVVDLWGGIADQQRNTPWTRDTMALVFSTTKGVTAICANKLAQEGRLDVDAPVAKYWPEFAQADKGDITVAQLLSHEAGLAWVDGEMTAEEAFAWDPVVDALARQRPHWEPGTKHGYHATTYGWLVGEVIRRVTGRSVGTYLRDEVAGPLDADFWIGLPESEEARVAPLVGFVDAKVLEDPEVRKLVEQFIGPETIVGRALSAPGGALNVLSIDIWNSRRLHAAEIPAANGIATARGLARLYAACVSDVDGMRLLSTEQVKRATQQRTSGPNIVLFDMDVQFGLGFMVRSDFVAISRPGSFGHFGAGGSVGWADPESELAFGYVMNRMDTGLTGDARSFNLLEACHQVVAQS